MKNEIAQEINEKFLELEQLIFENRREIQEWGEDLDSLDKVHNKYVTIAGKTGRKKREAPINYTPILDRDLTSENPFERLNKYSVDGLALAGVDNDN